MDYKNPWDYSTAPKTTTTTTTQKSGSVSSSSSSSSSSSATASGPTQSAYDILTAWFRDNLGITGDDISKIIYDAWQKGYTPADINLFLPDIEKTQSFQNRFPGYQEAVKRGYIQGGVGGIGQYLNLESQYYAKLSNAGLPKGFYDDHSDTGQWIASGVSVAEVENRINMAVNLANQVDPTMKNLMAKYYGLSTGDVAAYFLDPKRAGTLIEHQYNTAGVASWAQRAGLDANDASHYENLVDKGVTEQAASQGYNTVASLKNYLGEAAQVYGDNYTQSDAENDVFFNQNDKRRRIIANEQAAFGGGSQGNTGSAKRSSY